MHLIFVSLTGRIDIQKSSYFLCKCNFPILFGFRMTCDLSESHIYLRKSSRKKERKHTFDQEKSKIQGNKKINMLLFKKKVRFKKK